MDRFITIENRKNFLLSEVPELHPDSNAYLTFWRRHKKRCIEGFWSLDREGVTIEVDSNVDGKELSNKYDAGWRFMPPQLYFYVNFGTILHQPEDGPKAAPKKRIRPLLRDIEWEFFYNWLEARGFSGFSDDEEYSCVRELKVFLKMKADGHIPKFKLDPSCYNSKGELKKYIPAREYLRKLHNKPLGIPLYQNEAKNLFMLGSRGFGKSYMVGVGVVLHELIFDGAKIYNEESIQNPYKVEIFVGAALTDKSSDLLAKTKDALECMPGSWGQGDEYIPPPFYKQMSGSLKPNNGKNPWRHEYEKKLGGSWRKVGTGSNIKHGIYTTENPEAAAGTRPGVMVVEEVGLCPNILTVHGSNTACQMEGTVKFGSSVYLGTGGNMEKIVQSERIFRDPEGFDFLSFDDPEKPGRKIGWFVPSIYAMNQFKDKNGNTDVEAAMEYKLAERDEKLKSTDTSAIDLEMMNYPLKPSEMFLNKTGNIFPVAYLQERLAEVEEDEYLNAEYHGRLTIDTETGKVKWKPDEKARPLYNFPPSAKDDKTGAVVLYVPPIDNEGEIPYGRYIAGCDPYDHDKSGTQSLGSALVYDKLTKQIVAEYTGRPATAEMFFEEVRKLCLFYNAKLLYENEKKGIYYHFDNMNSLYLLQTQPSIIKDVVQNSKVDRIYGMHMNDPLKRYGEEAIKAWLLEPYNDTRGSEILNLHKLRCIPLLKEFIAYDPEGNYDRVMAFMMVMYFLQETKKIDIKKMQEEVYVPKSKSRIFEEGLTRVRAKRL